MASAQFKQLQKTVVQLKSRLEKEAVSQRDRISKVVVEAKKAREALDRTTKNLARRG